ncbi:MAG: PAS domain S-box protein [Calditrichaeota bacterium]|nr:PAS domain S-box protein [Calditrichota bacterium]
MDNHSPHRGDLRSARITVLVLAFALIGAMHAYYYFVRGLPVGNDALAWLLALGGAVALVEGTFRLLERRQASLEREINLCLQADEVQRREQEQLRRYNQALTRLTSSPLLFSGNLAAALQQITETSAHTLEVARVGVWMYVEERTKIRCLNLYELAANRHTSGHELHAAHYPAYFRALEEERVIPAHDARADEKTSEFAADYLEPLGITSMLDAPIRVNGVTVGVLCHEHVGPARHWTVEEQAFASSMADMVALAMEASERCRAEESLRESERNLRSIFDNMEDIYFLADNSGLLRKLSPAVERYGYKRQELIGRHVETVFFSAEERAAFLAELARQRSVRDFEVRLKYADGTPFHASVSARLILDDDGHCTGTEGIVRDISERKRQEAALKEAKWLYETLVRTSPEAILLVDPEGIFMAANERAAGLFGFASPGEMVGRPAIAVLPEEARRHARNMLPSCLPGQVVELEQTLLRQDKSSFLAEVSASAIYAADGRLRGYVAIVRDVTARKQAEQEIERRQKYLESVLVNSPSAIVTLDNNHRVVEWNKAAEHIFGYSREEALGKDIDELIAKGEVREEATGLTQHVLSGKDILAHEAVRLRKDGTPVDVIVSGSPIRVGDELHGVVAVYTDISERKRSQAALQESEERFRNLVETSPDGIVIHSQGKVLFANRAAARILGYEGPEAMLGGSVMDCVHPDYRQIVLERVQKMMATGEPVPAIEEKFLRADGTVVDVEVAASPVVVGGQLASQVVFRDITARKREEKVREAIYKLSEAANSADDLQALFHSIHAIVGELMPARNFYIALHHPETGTLSFPYFVDENDEPPKPRKLGRGLTEYVLKKGTALLVRREGFAELVASGEIDAIGTPSVDWLGVPLVGTTGTIGVLAVQSYTEGVRFGEEEKRILQFVSNQAAMAIERKRSSEQLKASLREKEVLLKEIHHRVKNNMQVISSMLNLQSGCVANPEVEAVLRDSQNRVRSMALIHEKLYQSRDLSRIDFSDYIRKLTDDLFRSYSVNPERITLTTHAEEVSLGIDAAIPCGLIINELVSNCLKHAFPDGRSGEVQVSLLPKNGMYELRVKDNGVGFPKDLDFRNTDSLGLQLVTTLTEQLDGTIELNCNGEGTEFRILFKRDE